MYGIHREDTITQEALPETEKLTNFFFFLRMILNCGSKTDNGVNKQTIRMQNMRIMKQVPHYMYTIWHNMF